MQSNGGLAEVGALRGKDAILSGPAGGVARMVPASTPLRPGRPTGFHMGRSRPVVACYPGEYEPI